MQLIILKNKRVVLEVKVESREEVNTAITSATPFNVVQRSDGGFKITYRNKPIYPEYGDTWKIEEVLYDALKSGYLSRSQPNYTFLNVAQYF